MKHTPYAYRGFTLIELSISMAIIGLLTALLLVRYPDTAVRMTLVNHVQSTALLVREAQVRGSSIDTNLGAFGGYGVSSKNSTPENALERGVSLVTQNKFPVLVDLIIDPNSGTASGSLSRM